MKNLIKEAWKNIWVFGDEATGTPPVAAKNLPEKGSDSKQNEEKKNNQTTSAPGEHQPKVSPTNSVKHLMGNHLQMVWRVALITLCVMSVLGGGGYYLDKLLKTKPAFMVVGLIASYPLAQIIIYKVFIKLVKKPNGSTSR